MTAGARRALSCAALGLLAITATGCDWILGLDKEYLVPPLNRVQPGALDKSFFVGSDFEDASDDPRFWWQPTLIDISDAPAEDGLFTSGATLPVNRIRWELSSELLVARATHRPLDATGNPPWSELDGVIVAAFPVLSHFDIVYDAADNTLQEDQVQKPWFERAYFRVDWGTNLAVEDYPIDIVSAMGLQGSVKYIPHSLYVNDPSHPNAPRFEIENGYFDITHGMYAQQGASLFDLSTLGLSGPVNACYLALNLGPNSDVPGACLNVVELAVRHSFRRIADDDHAPEPWDDARSRAWNASGATTKSGDDLHRVAHRFHIWERSHHYTEPTTLTGAAACNTAESTPPGADPQRDLDGNGTADECEAAGSGSICDTVSRKCTLPVQERETSPVVWYYTTSGESDLFDATREAAHQWDVALRASVMAARYAECRHTGGADCDSRFPVITGQMDEHAEAVALAREVDDCRERRAYEGMSCEEIAEQLAAARGHAKGVLALARMPEMVVLCHSPVEATDPAACGAGRLPPGTTAAMCAAAESSGDDALAAKCDAAFSVRRGDLRYNQIHVLAGSPSASPWSAVTVADDPVTGQRLSAAITVWAGAGEIWSRGITDRMRYVAGELSTLDVTDAADVGRWVEAAGAASERGTLGTMSREDVVRRVAGVAGVDGWGNGAVGDEVIAQIEQDGALVQKLEEARDTVRRVRADARQASSTGVEYTERIAGLRSLDIESALTTKPIRRLVGADGLPYSESMLHVASPARGANRLFWRRIQRMKDLALAEADTCLLHDPPAPASLVELSAMLGEKVGPFDPSSSKEAQEARAERMRRYLARRMHEATVLHQLGHALGLRHNLAGSADAFNYHPQYWQLRTRNGAVTAPCSDASDDGEACVGPRWLDPTTAEEREGLHRMFMQSSAMDLPGDPTQGMVGLGAYDFAALRMLYTGVAAVHRSPDYRAGTARGRGVLEKIDDAGGVLGFSPRIGAPDGTSASDLHHSEIQARYGSIDPASCREVDPGSLEPAAWDEEAQGVFHPVLDGHVVRVGGKYTVCKQQAVDYVFWSSLRTPSAGSGEVGANYGGGPAVDSTGRVRLAFGVAADRDADVGNLSAQRHDLGADAYELFDFLSTQQEVEQIFDSYGRSHPDLHAMGAVHRDLTHYGDKLREASKGLALFKGRVFDIAAESGGGVAKEALWTYAARRFFTAQALGASAAIDRLTISMERPEPGEHVRRKDDSVLRPRDPTSPSDDKLPTAIVLPNGAVGTLGHVTPGAKPLVAEITDPLTGELVPGGGSYYDKLWAATLLTEAEDNFAEGSLDPLLEPHRRRLSAADLFPDAYRRWLATGLTDDQSLNGVRIAADAAGDPLAGPGGFPAGALGFTSWWMPAPEVCFPGASTRVCSTFGAPDSLPSNPQAPAHLAVLAPAIGWEQQIALLVWAWVHLPHDGSLDWHQLLETTEVYSGGAPDYPARIELHLPNGSVYVARTHGVETVFGKTVQRGIAARVLEYGNSLVEQAYETDPVTVNGVTWHVPKIDPQSGKPIPKNTPTSGRARDLLETYDLPWYLARMTTWAVEGPKGRFPEGL